MKSIAYAAFAALAMLVSPVFGEINTGDQGPAFTLKGLDGKEHSLADFSGKVVVLEWTNPGCPFVKKHYDGSKNIPDLQKKYTGKEVIWLTVASGNTAGELSEEAKGNYNSTAVLLDPSGEVGKAYDAKTTPQIVILDKEGKVAYQGAIDSKESTDAADIASSENYVAAALDAILDGKAVEKAKTKPYGCGVKY